MAGSGPASLYQNPTYAPAVSLISAITNDINAQITTTFAHGYQPLLVVRINTSEAYGMVQIDQQVGTVLTVIDDTNFTIDIDTTHYEPFAVPAFTPPYTATFPGPFIKTIPTVVPVGEDNSTLYLALKNVL